MGVFGTLRSYYERAYTYMYTYSIYPELVIFTYCFHSVRAVAPLDKEVVKEYKGAGREQLEGA